MGRVSADRRRCEIPVELCQQPSVVTKNEPYILEDRSLVGKEMKHHE